MQRCTRRPGWHGEHIDVFQTRACELRHTRLSSPHGRLTAECGGGGGAAAELAICLTALDELSRGIGCLGVPGDLDGFGVDDLGAVVADVLDVGSGPSRISHDSAVAFQREVVEGDDAIGGIVTTGSDLLIHHISLTIDQFVQDVRHYLGGGGVMTNSQVNE